ncbi:hypothetical protein BDA96_08G013300 [Sorghum bicolor]|uniref:RNA polymerase subunit H/Rpb5 C-terminal domain-containing protein n=1 Tax=Sorghum bicolor TaxID=4558 RepID=A0A921QCH8_SORBI|nr:hypothetical protein BDA96_08G013300 [Sorghum bicolor]
MRPHCRVSSPTLPWSPPRRVSSLKPPCLPTTSARQSHTMLVRRVRSPKQRPRSLAHWRCGRVVASTHRAVRSLARRAATLAKKKVTTLAHQSHKPCIVFTIGTALKRYKARESIKEIFPFKVDTFQNARAATLKPVRPWPPTWCSPRGTAAAGTHQGWHADDAEVEQVLRGRPGAAAQLRQRARVLRRGWQNSARAPWPVVRRFPPPWLTSLRLPDGDTRPMVETADSDLGRHVLKPKHEVLTVEEKVKLQKDYNVVDSHLPLMLESDAVAHYQGFRQGTVVKVTYDNELTGNHVTYRCIF